MSRIYLSPPELAGTESAALNAALASGWIAPLGPEVDAFEQAAARTAQQPFALALSSGTAALHLALLALGVGPGDSVLVSTLTFAASANPIRYCGAEPIFIDSDATWNMCPALLAQTLGEQKRLERRPRAVIGVGLYGSAANMKSIAEVCAQHDVPLIEDAAEAIGATHHERPAGSFGELAALSFNGNKIITTSGGGMLLGRSDAALARARYLSTQARAPVRHYEHQDIGYNYRMSNLLAAMGRVQLSDLDRRVIRRRAINQAYRVLLEPHGWQFQPDDAHGRATFWLSCATVPGGTPHRDRILDALAAADIEARPTWKPMHQQPVFSGCQYVGAGVADAIFANGLCLPSGGTLSDHQIEHVVQIALAA